MSEKRLGILGGMGPQATNDFYQFILDRTDAHKDQEHLSTVIFSDADMPDRTAAILSGETQPVYDRMLAGAKLLEDCGCHAIAVPCNTAHFFLDRVQEEIRVPIIHMIRETALELERQGRKKACILGTDGTIQSGLYQAELEQRGVGSAVPDPETQRLVMSLIYDEIKAGHPGDMDKFSAIHRGVRALDCDCVVIACTEMSVFAGHHKLPSYYVDAMSVLARRCLEVCEVPVRPMF